MKDKTKLKASAAAAANAAARRKTNVVELSVENELRVRDILKELNVLDPAHWKIAAQTASTDAQEVGELYDSLLAYGFRDEQVQQAVQALQAGPLSEESAMDWLCLNLASSEMPRQLAGSSQPRTELAGVKVMASAADAKAARHEASRSQAKPVPTPAKPSKPSQADMQKQQMEREKAKAEKEQQRAWIMQYMEEEPSSEEEAAGPSGEPDDWDPWADPRERARRKAERQRANMPIEERRMQVAQEWKHMREEAAGAKAAGDKDRQKAAGLFMRDLKSEMAQIGMSEEDANALVNPSSGPKDASDDGEWPALGDSLSHVPANGKGRADAAWDDTDDGSEAADNNIGALSDGELDDDVPSASQPAAATAAEPVQKQAASSSSQPQEEDLPMGMFDEDGPAADWPEETAAKKAPAALVGPWGSYGGKVKASAAPAMTTAKRKGLKARPQPPQEEPKLPRTLLQQHCQREKLPMPRFDKLAPGGFRLPQAGTRYTVTLEPAAQGPGPKRKGQQAAKVYGLKEEEDGWDTIQEAQNAACTAALYQLASGQPLWQLLMEPYRTLWLSWEDSKGSNVSTDAQEQQAAANARSDFIAFIVAAARAARGRAQAAAQSSKHHGQNGVVSGGMTRQEQRHAERDRREVEGESRAMLDRLREFEASQEGQGWLAKRRRLPVWAIHDPLLQALERHNVAVVSGDTGCGKTTQVPQYLLDAAAHQGRGGECSIICTQPRRIAAISVADRVAAERCESAPGTPGSRVGYHVRLDAAASRSTRLLFCTTGILLRRMASDPHLNSVSHVIVDEVHERTIQGDFLMALLKDIVAERQLRGNPLKVVLMSATLDSDLFARYYGGCPVLTAGGRTFPVQQHFLEDVYEATGYRLDAEGPSAHRGKRDKAKQRQLQNAASSRHRSTVQAGWGDDELDKGATNPHFDPELYNQYSSSTQKNLSRLDENRIDFDVLEDLILHIDSEFDDGAILVFLPGMGEIGAMLDRLSAVASSRKGKRWLIPLHSSIQPADQRQAFEIPPSGTRKIVLATNIAETSLTIPDVVYVIDSGKLKERRYDASRRMSLLVEDWVSAANALQRKGRAGRVRPGQCFCLYTRHRFEQRMRRFQAPEMVRIPLEELVLQIHSLGLGPAAQFFERVLEPPPAKSITGAIAQLSAVGALSEDERLTPLGTHLAQLPMDAKVGKLLLLAACLGCLAPALTIAAYLSHRSPFLSDLATQDAVARARAGLAASGVASLAAGQQSDHLLMVAAYDAWAAALAKGGKKAAAGVARSLCLSQTGLEMLADMRGQFAVMLAEAHFIAPPQERARSDLAWIDDPRLAWNAHAKQPAVVKAVLCAAMHPNICVMDESASSTTRPAWNDGTGDVHLHPSSICHPLEADKFLRPYLTYSEKMKTSRTFIRECSIVSPLSLLLFGGSLQVRHADGITLVDGWLRVRTAAQTAVLVKQLRVALDAMLQQKIGNPQMDITGGASGVVPTIVKLLSDE